MKQHTSSKAVVKSKKLFVGDLSKFCTEQDLVNIFSSFGQLQEVSVKRSSDNGAALSYGFVTFSNEVEATNALRNLNGTLFFGRKLRIRWAVQNTENPGKPRKEAVINSLYIRFHTKEINYYVTEEDLHTAFDPYGNVTDIAIKESNIDQSTATQSGYGFVHFTSDYHGIQSALRAVGGLDNQVIDSITYSVEPSKNLLKQFESMPGYKDSAPASIDMPPSQTGANYNPRSQLNRNAPVYNPPPSNHQPQQMSRIFQQSQMSHSYQQPQMSHSYQQPQMSYSYQQSQMSHSYQQPQMSYQQSQLSHSYQQPQMYERLAPPSYKPATKQSSLGGDRRGTSTPPMYFPRAGENILQQSKPRIDDLLGLNEPYPRGNVSQYNTSKSASVTRCVSPANDMYNHFSKSAENTPRTHMHWDSDLIRPPGLSLQNRNATQSQSGPYEAYPLEVERSQYTSSQSCGGHSLPDWSLAESYSNKVFTGNDFSSVRVSPPVPQLHLPVPHDDFFYESVNAGYISALPPLSPTGSHSDLSQLTTNSNNLEDADAEKIEKQGLFGNTATNSISSGFTSFEGDRSIGMNRSTNTLSSLDGFSINCSLNKYDGIDQEKAPVEDIYGSLDACF